MSLATKDPASATEQFRQWKIGVHPKQLVEIKPRQRTHAPSGLMTLAQGLDRCLKTEWAGIKAKATYRSYVRRISSTHGDTLLVDISYDWLLDYKAKMVAEGRALGTVKGYVDAIGKVLKEALDWKYPDGSPVLKQLPRKPSFELRNEKERVLTYEEEKKAFELIEQRRCKQPHRAWAHFARLLRFLIDTGCRLDEALQTHESHIIERNGHHFLHLSGSRTKTKKSRQVPLSAAIVHDLTWLRSNSVGGRLFPMLPSMAWYLWKQIREDLGNAEDVVLHSMRHTCATRLLQHGMDIYRVSRWLGHKDISMTAKRYGHLVADDLVQGIDLLASNPVLTEDKFRIPDNQVNGTKEKDGLNSDRTSQL